MTLKEAITTLSPLFSTTEIVAATKTNRTSINLFKKRFEVKKSIRFSIGTPVEPYKECFATIAKHIEDTKRNRNRDYSIRLNSKEKVIERHKASLMSQAWL